MVHKKYTYKNGKRYGPYLYETKRVNGKIVTTYLGTASENVEDKCKRTFNPFPILIILGLVLAVSFAFLYFPTEFTGRATLDVQTNYKVGELITGNLNLNIKSGELIPGNSMIVISLGDVVKEIPLSELVSENLVEGEFYAESLEISGDGDGFGLLGNGIIYPEIEFDLKVFDSEESDISGSDSSEETEEIVEENKSEEFVEDVNDSVLNEEETPESEAEEETAGANEAEEIIEEELETEAEEILEEEISVEDEVEEVEDESSSAPLTGEVILENENIISGVVSFENEFSYSLQDGKSVELIEDSLNVEEAKLMLKIVEGNAVVSTDYSEVIEGFGEEFLGEDKLVLKIDLSKFEFIAEENSELKVELIYGENVLAEEEKDISVEELVEVVNETLINETTVANVTVNTTQYGAVLGQPVRWKKKIELSEGSELSVELPSVASNVSVIKVVGSEVEEIIVEVDDEVVVEEVVPEVEEANVTGNVLTGMVTIEVSDEVVEEVLKKEDSVLVEFNESVDEVEIEYETPAPYSEEEELENKKIVKIVGPEEVHYENVLAFTELSEDYGITNPQQVRINWIENETFLKPQRVGDSNENGIYDYIEWIVPHLSNQTFEIIVIVKAEHLDENRTSISDIYEEVAELDGNWSETILENHYVRIVFEKNLTSDKDITIYPRIVSGTPRVEVYEANGTELIAEFASINSEELNKIYLTSLNGEQDTFDLKVVGGSLEFDYIVDPTDVFFEDCDSLSEWTLNPSSGKYWKSSMLDVCTCTECTAANMTFTSSLDLSSNSNVNLSFDWWTTSFQSGDFLKIYASDDGGSSYVEMFSQSSSSSGLDEKLKLEDYISLTSTVKLMASCSSHVSGGRSDPQGRCKWDSINLTGYDLVGPGVTINVPTNSNYSSATFDFNITLDENGSVMFSLDDGTTNYTMDSTDNQNFNYTNSSVDDGSYTFQIYANDTEGNDNHTESVNFVVDTTSPVVSIVSPINNSYSSDTGLDVLYTATDTNLDSCWRSLDEGATNTTQSSCSNITIFSWSEGENNVRIYANDSAGNEASDEIMFTIDTTYPTFDSSTPLNQTYTSVRTTFNPQESDTNMDSCWYSLDSGTTNSSYTCSSPITGLDSGQGSSTWTAYANDSAGNENSSSVTFFVDSIAPEVTINLPENITYGWNNLSMDFNVSLNEAGSVMFSLNGGTTNHTMDSTDNLNFNYTNSSMIDGSYTFQVYANDTEENTNYSESVVFTVNNSLVYDCGTLSDVGRTYYLQNNVYDSRSCFTITADNITFDGGNYNVDGDGSGTDEYGVEMANRFNVTVKNMNITDFVSGGIKMTSVTNSTILLNSVDTGSDGIFISGGSDNSIQNNTFTNNGNAGIRIESDENSFEYNSITSPGHGIAIKNGGDNNTFYKDEVDSATSSGLLLHSGTGNEFNETLFNNSDSSAILFYTANENTFNNVTIENTTSSNYDLEISLNDADENRFVDTPLENYSISGTGSKLIFKETGLGEIVFLEVINGSGTNLSSDIQIADNFVYVDSTSNSGLNKSANVTLYGTPAGSLSNPDILRDGEICSSSVCYNFTSLTAETVVFNVTSWSNYTIGDATAPALTIVSPSNNTFTTDSGLDILYTATDSNLDTCWYSDEGDAENTSLSSCANITSVTWGEEQHNVTVWANDTSGNENSSLIVFTIDRTYPTFNITQPLNQTYTSVQTSFGHGSTDSNLDTCWYSLDGGATNTTISPCGFSPSGLDSGQGSSTWTIYANDSAGNENSSSVTFFVDSIAPNVTINVPENITYTTSSFVFDVDLSENGSVEFSLDDGATNYTMTSTNNQNFTYSTSLSDGTYTFQVYANDTEGNTNHTENVTFSVDVPEEEDSSGGGGGGSSFVLQTTDFSVSPSSLTVSIVKGESEKRTIEIENNGKETISVSSNIEDIENLVELSSDRFSLDSLESFMNGLKITANKEEGTYAGKIYFSAGDSTEEVKVVINIKSDDLTFDSSIAIKSEQKEVESGEDVVAQININQIGTEKKLKEYKVRIVVENFEGEVVFTKEIVVESVEESVILESIPTDDLSPGSYIAELMVIDENTEGSAIDTASVQFEVKGKTLESNNKERFILIFSIGLALVIVFFLYFFLARRNRIKKVLKYKELN